MTEGTGSIRPKVPDEFLKGPKHSSKGISSVIDDLMKQLPKFQSKPSKLDSSLYSGVVQNATPTSRLKKLEDSLTNEEINSVTKGFVASFSVLAESKGVNNELIELGLQRIGAIEGKLTSGIAGIAIEQVKSSGKKSSTKEQFEAKTTGQIRAGLGLIATGTMRAFVSGIPKERFQNFKILSEKHDIKKIDQGAVQDRFKGIHP